MRRHPVLVAAALAILAALAGTAVAGPGASTSAISKKKVKKIVAKEVAKLAPGLSVASAQTAQTTNDAQALGGEPPSAFERSGRILKGSASSTDPLNLDLIRDPQTGAVIQNDSPDGRIRIINTSTSRTMKVAGVATFGTGVLEPKFANLAPGASAVFVASTFGPYYLDVVITLGGPTAADTPFSHLTCGEANGAGGFPSIVSCMLVS